MCRYCLAGAATPTSASAGASGTAATPSSIGGVTCTYGSWSCHSVQERERAYGEYGAAFREAVARLAARFDAALGEVDAWEATWNSKVGALVASNSSAGTGGPGSRAATARSRVRTGEGR